MSWPHRMFASQFSDFELKLLHVFRVVVECQGFSDAEVELGLTKSAISKSISDLELRLGARLCERGRGGFHLTNAGEVVHDATTHLLAALEGFRSRVNSFHTSLAGEFFFGCIECLSKSAQVEIQRVIAAYTTRHPAVCLNVIIGSAAEIDRAIEEQRLHAGISVQRQSTPLVESKEIYQETSYLYRASALSKRFAHLETDFETLTRHIGFVRHGYSAEEGRLVDALNLKVGATSNHTEGILQFIMSGSYLGYLPEHIARSYVAAGEIVRVGDLTPKCTTIAMKWNAHTGANPLVREFVSIAKPILGYMQ